MSKRYVMLVVTAARRSDGTGQRLDVVEFHNKRAAQKARDHLQKYENFDTTLVEDDGVE